MTAYNSVEALEVLVLPTLATALAEMMRAGVPDPVGTLRRCQGGATEPALQPYTKLFAHLRGLYGFRDNAPQLEQAMQQAVDLAASVVV